MDTPKEKYNIDKTNPKTLDEHHKENQSYDWENYADKLSAKNSGINTTISEVIKPNDVNIFEQKDIDILLADENPLDILVTNSILQIYGAKRNRKYPHTQYC